MALDARQFRQLFSEVVQRSAGELLATVQPELTLGRSPSDQPLRTAGVVGFVGPNLRGLFSVAANAAALEAQPPELHDDWMGELSNQLAGRVKNQLLREGGPPFTVAPPVTMSGTELQVATSPPTVEVHLGHSDTTYAVQAVLEVLGPIDLETTDQDEHPADEGDVLLF